MLDVSALPAPCVSICRLKCVECVNKLQVSLLGYVSLKEGWSNAESLSAPQLWPRHNLCVLDLAFSVVSLTCHFSRVLDLPFSVASLTCHSLLCPWPAILYCVLDLLYDHPWPIVLCCILLPFSITSLTFHSPSSIGHRMNKSLFDEVYKLFLTEHCCLAHLYGIFPIS